MRGTYLGGEGGGIIWIIVFWGLYWGPPTLANYHSCTDQTVLCENGLGDSAVFV